MPIYPYRCACGNVSEQFNRVATRESMICPKCGSDACTIHYPGLTVNDGDPPWSGVRGESTAMAFQEAGIADITRDAPSMEFKRDRHQPGVVVPVFKSDKHHRQCLREIEAARQKYAAERAEQPARKR